MATSSLVRFPSVDDVGAPCWAYAWEPIVAVCRCGSALLESDTDWQPMGLRPRNQERPSP